MALTQAQKDFISDVYGVDLGELVFEQESYEGTEYRYRDVNDDTVWCVLVYGPEVDDIVDVMDQESL